MGQQKQTRLSNKSLILIRMYAGERQAESGENYTDDKAVLELFKQCRPDLLEKAERLEKSK